MITTTIFHKDEKGEKSEEEEQKKEKFNSSSIKQFQLTQQQIDLINSLLPKCFSIQHQNTQKVSKSGIKNIQKISKKIVKQTKNGEKIASQVPIVPNGFGTLSAAQSHLSSNQVDEQSQVLSSQNNILTVNGNGVPQIPGALSKQSNNNAPVNQSLREKRGKMVSKNYYDYESVNGSSHHHGGASNSTANSHASAAAQFMKKATEDMKICMKILNKLKAHKSASPFLLPVDPIAQQCENYFEIVKEPIDLSLVEKTLIEGGYETNTQFYADIQQIWSNSYLYNAQGSLIYKMTMDMDKYFKQLVQEFDGVGVGGFGGSLHGSASQNDEHNSMVMLQRQVDLLTQKIQQFHTNQRVGGGTSAGGSNGTGGNGGQGGSGGAGGGSQKGKAASWNPQTSDLPMTLQEKRILGQHIRSLPAFYLKGVWEIVQEANMGTQGGEQLEFDINKLPNEVARQLDMYVQDQVMQLNQQKSKKQPANSAPNNSTLGKVSDSSITSTNNTNNNYAYHGSPGEENKSKSYSGINDPNNYNAAKDETLYQYNSSTEFVNSNSTQQIEVSALSDTDGDDNDSDSSLITDSGEVR